MVRPLNSVSMGPLPHFICCKVDSFSRNNAVWNTMIVEKAFCKSTDGSSDRSIACREDKSVSRVKLYSIKKETVSPP